MAPQAASPPPTAQHAVAQCHDTCTCVLTLQSTDLTKWGCPPAAAWPWIAHAHAHPPCLVLAPRRTAASLPGAPRGRCRHASPRPRVRAGAAPRSTRAHAGSTLAPPPAMLAGEAPFRTRTVRWQVRCHRRCFQGQARWQLSQLWPLQSTLLLPRGRMRCETQRVCYAQSDAGVAAIILMIEACLASPLASIRAHTTT